MKRAIKPFLTYQVRKRKLFEKLNLFRFGIIDAKGVDCDLFHPLILRRTVGKVCRNGSYFINGFHAGNHLAECGILPVEMRRVSVHYEKLASRGVRSHGARH